MIELETAFERDLRQVSPIARREATTAVAALACGADVRSVSIANPADPITVATFRSQQDQAIAIVAGLIDASHEEQERTLNEAGLYPDADEWDGLRSEARRIRDAHGGAIDKLAVWLCRFGTVNQESLKDLVELC